MSKNERDPQHKRKLRNYLLDVGLQLRYTVFIIAVAVFLTGVLGWRIHVAMQETNRAVNLTTLVDPGTAGDLLQEFQAKDRIVLWAIVGFGLVLVLTVTALGIWMTHKIAGPLRNISSVFARIRDNKLPEDIRHLRKGDELQAFHASLREMYEAIRARVVKDKETLEKAITAITAQAPRSAELDQVLEELRTLQQEKAHSLMSQAPTESAGRPGEEVG
jgi:methyl-accepting chemotaxis protein